MVQVRKWLRSAVVLLALGGLLMNALQAAGGHALVRVAGDDPKVHTGG